MRRVLAVLGLVGFVVGAFVVPSAQAGPLEDQFFQMDTSRDGSLSRSEFAAFQIANGVTERRANFAFENLRGDDNLVSLTEFRAGPSVARQSPQRLERRRSNARQDSRSRNRNRSRARPSRQPSRGGGGS